MTTPVAATESAAATVHRVRPVALGRRLDALLQTTDVTAPSRPVIELGSTVLLALAEAPHRHAVSLRVQGTPTPVRSRLPAGLATVHEIAHLDGGVRVRLRAERLDWLPAVRAGLDLPFAIEHPDALRDLARSLGERLASAADASLVSPMHCPRPARGPTTADPGPTSGRRDVSASCRIESG